MNRLNWFLIICAIVCFAIGAFPNSEIRVSPVVLLELGNAHNRVGETEIAKAYYQLVLEFEDRFGYRGSYLPKYQQMAKINLHNLEINKVLKASPLFRRGK